LELLGEPSRDWHIFRTENRTIRRMHMAVNKAPDLMISSALINDCLQPPRQRASKK
jgi:hypothetical protein